MIKVNKDKAVIYTIERIRLERNESLLVNDEAYMMALKSGLDCSEILKERQDLLDVTGKNFKKLSIKKLSSLTLESALAM